MIALDFMGGDHGPSATIPAALEAATEGIPVAVVGDESLLTAASRDALRAASIEIVHAPDAIGMAEKGTARIRKDGEEGQSSLRVAAELVKSGRAAAMVSMGNTGAAMMAALRVLGRLPGVERPALAVLLPGGQQGTLFLDAGANADARPVHLVQFAQLGSAFMRAARGVEQPTVSLLSNGEEPSKGSTLVLEAHRMLTEASHVQFAGNVEGRELIGGRVDVLVTDGFTGNVSVKLIEGLVALLAKETPSAGAPSGSLREQLNARHHGAAPLLGVNGPVFIGHGSSDAATIVTALRVAQRAVDGGLMAAFTAALGGGAASEASSPSS